MCRYFVDMHRSTINLRVVNFDKHSKLAANPLNCVRCVNDTGENWNHIKLN